MLSKNSKTCHAKNRSWTRASRTTIRPILSSSTRRRRNGYSKKSVNKKGNSMLNKISRLRPQDDQEGEVVL
uniref:Ribosomal protein L32 n=1 Tax=Ditylenchus dipsaci TaxID=166011 RepID=A0A915DT64_9BILA